MQGYLALDMIRKNNLELIKGVERARTTTVAALRTAVVVAQALANQRLVLDQIGALNEATNTMIGRTSELLKQQIGRHDTSRPPAPASASRRCSTRSTTSSRRWTTIDSYSAKAVEGMAQTVTALEGADRRGRSSYLERSAASEQIREAHSG